ncbi:hypothetical protein AVEN_19451-1 [Araneus ventricosus]|uniref:Tc1-like transposase DDE domain-containing protein n=1 Tax=Araneus ventricosus TaxID=182803 RepID=A0A4Y2C9G4_ARAVE|nr:hypothetical protein AVEN_19451-1 [Araneus ventricosus]
MCLASFIAITLGYGALRTQIFQSNMNDTVQIECLMWSFARCCKRGPFFFVEKTINGDVCRDLHELYVIPLLEHLDPNVLFQQDCAPPHWTRSSNIPV